MPPETDPTPDPKADPTPEPTKEPTPEPSGTDPDPDAGAKKALETERARAKEADKRAKAAEAELEKFRKSQMSDQEKAVAQARDEGKAEATSAAAQRLAGAEIKAALATVVADADKRAEIIDDLNLSRYIGEDGEPDAEKIAALRDRYAALTAGAPGTPPPGVPKGARSGNGEVKQLSQNDLKSMGTAEIVAARKAGQFDDLMSTPKP